MPVNNYPTPFIWTPNAANHLWTKSELDNPQVYDTQWQRGLYQNSERLVPYVKQGTGFVQYRPDPTLGVGTSTQFLPAVAPISADGLERAGLRSVNVPTAVAVANPGLQEGLHAAVKILPTSPVELLIGVDGSAAQNYRALFTDLLGNFSSTAGVGGTEGIFPMPLPAPGFEWFVGIFWTTTAGTGMLRSIQFRMFASDGMDGSRPYGWRAIPMGALVSEFDSWADSVDDYFVSAGGILVQFASGFVFNGRGAIGIAPSDANPFVDNAGNFVDFPTFPSLLSYYSGPASKGLSAFWLPTSPADFVFQATDTPWMNQSTSIIGVLESTQADSIQMTLRPILHVLGRSASQLYPKEMILADADDASLALQAARSIPQCTENPKHIANALQAAKNLGKMMLRSYPAVRKIAMPVARSVLPPMAVEAISIADKALLKAANKESKKVKKKLENQVQRDSKRLSQMVKRSS
jgi:hypothetical protein